MKRSAFTMIELIFVIVILGILAAVAIPKLSATRDDAKIAKASGDLRNLVSDIGNYYTSQGTFRKPSDMTNVTLDTDTTAHDTALTTNYEVESEDCIAVIFTATSSGNGEIMLKHVGDATNILCNWIVTDNAVLVGGIDGNKTYVFGGQRVVF